MPEVGTYFFLAGGMTPSPGAAYDRIWVAKMRFVRVKKRGVGRVRDMLAARGSRGSGALRELSDGRAGWLWWL